MTGSQSREPARAGLDPQRAAEIVAEHPMGGGRRGSGYLVADGIVLTAAHVLAGATNIRVRFNADQPGEWSALAQEAWSNSELDVVLLRIIESSITASVAVRAVLPPRYGRITRPPVDCEALGFPLFKLREDPARPQLDGRASRYRDSHHATGTATSWSNRREGTMAVNVRAPERSRMPERSPWEGMAGAAVFSGDCLIGIVGEHHRSDGLGTLAAYRLDHWYEHLTAEQIGEIKVLIGIPSSVDGLAEVSAFAPLRAGSSPRQLPGTTSVFTGRTRELGLLVDFATTTACRDSPGTGVIFAIDGMAGIGKTALAVHAAHQVADRFPDGQLFIDLHGYTQDMAPRDPADALAVFLQSLGVLPQQIPADVDSRAALFRDRLAGTRTLILLDNAATEAQVRPLLPASDGCLVLITSRKRLKALDNAHPLPLDVLPLQDAVTLFQHVADIDHGPDNDPLLRRIAHLCGRLPLAVRIAAALIRNRPNWTAQRLADKLSARLPDLEEFSDGNRNLATVFDLSYQTLTGDQRVAFRRAGQVPGPDIDAYAAAALLDTGLDGAERLLQDLVDHNLLAEPIPGRYQMHDLLRSYARTQAGYDHLNVRTAAVNRLLDYYAHTANSADVRIARRTRPEPTGPAPAYAPELSEPEQARTWLRAERANLLACIEHTAAADQDERTVSLTAGLATLQRTDGPWTQASSLNKAAAAAAERLGDRLGQAHALTELGVVQFLSGDYPDAVHDLEEALDLYRGLGDRLGQANALTELGPVRRITGFLSDAARDLEEALDLYRGLGDRLGQANALTDLGAVRRVMSEYPDAARNLDEALHLYQELDYKRGQANALTQLGTVRRLRGDYPAAVLCHEQALELYRELDNLSGQAGTLIYLGVARRLIGDLSGAARDLESALDLYGLLGDRNDQAVALTELGVVRRVSGDLTEAARDHEQALTIFRQIGARGNEACALNHYAAVFATAGDLVRALDMYGDALHLAREVEMPDEQAIALEGIGECLAGAGNGRDAVEHLEQALSIFQRLAMPDAERVNTRLTELRDP